MLESSGKDNFNGVKSLAESFGINISDGQRREAEQVWDTLNKLSESDPAAYNDFIKSQMEEMYRQERDLSNEQNDNKDSFIITPEKGFVIETSARVSLGDVVKKEHNAVLFVNFCHHNSINIPLDVAGNQISIENDAHNKSDLASLQIPFVISKCRKTKKEIDYNNTELIFAVDIILHPWCISTCDKSEPFRDDLCKLCLTFVQQEHREIFHTISTIQCRRVIGCSYKFGTGPKNCDVHPYVVNASSTSSQKLTDTIMESPSSLLRKISSSAEENGNEPTTNQEIKLSKPLESKSKPLIQEISKNPKITTKTSNKMKIKKGFLL